MPQLEVSIDEAAKAEGLTAVHVQRIAEVDGRFAEASSHGTFRIGGGVGRTMCVDPGHYSLDAYWRDGRWTRCHQFVGLEGSYAVELSPENSRRRVLEVDPSPSGPDETAGVQFEIMTMDDPEDGWQFVLDPASIENRSTIYKVATAAPEADVVPVRRPARPGRFWLAYSRDGRPVLASLPLPPAPCEETSAVLRTRPMGIPAVAFSEDHLEVAVMGDLLSCGNSGAEMRYLSTFSLEEISRLFESKPLPFLSFAYAETCASYDRGILGMVGKGYHEEWLSDVLILRGWQCLTWAKREEDLDGAARRFEQAVQVGVPFYSRALDLLCRGLMLLEEQYTRLVPMGRLVRRLSARVVPEETFTTVRLDQ